MVGGPQLAGGGLSRVGGGRARRGGVPGGCTQLVDDVGADVVELLRVEVDPGRVGQPRRKLARLARPAVLV